VCLLFLMIFVVGISSGALPDEDTQVPIEEAVEVVLSIVRNFESVGFPNNGMPPGSIDAVQVLFNVLTSILD